MRTRIDVNAIAVMLAILDAAKGPDTALDAGTLLPNKAYLAAVEQGEDGILMVTFTNGDVMLVTARFPDLNEETLPMDYNGISLNDFLDLLPGVIGHVPSQRVCQLQDEATRYLKHFIDKNDDEGIQYTLAVLSFLDYEYERYDQQEDARPFRLDEEDTLKWLNRYECPECSTKWVDIWDSQVDDQCPKCGCKNVSPFQSEEVRP